MPSAAIRQAPVEMHDACGSYRALLPSENPNGIPSQSPGLRGTSYPGKTSEENHNPNGVVANVTRAPDENGFATTALRLENLR